ncbi:MAG TPA: hypothetical protein VMM17_10000 [Gemmatimonadaceae bacterium]|nr:hypothetical protein [Gemmatimonadaceae bacterium]
MPGENQRKPRKSAARKEGAAQVSGRGAAAKMEGIGRRNAKRRARNEDKPGQGEAGTRHIDAPEERDRGPVGTKGRGAPGHSKPGRR